MSRPFTLCLMRHGEAAWSTPDSERKLTERGVEQSQRALVQLQAALQPGLARLLCSPFQRARQTAAEAQKLTGLKASLHDFLTPDEPPAETLQSLANLVEDRTLIVAHQPLLGSLVGLLTEGNLYSGYPFGTSEIVVLEIEMCAAGCGRIMQTFRP